MTTYTTIKAAFANGSGDRFFEKNGEFICVSRKADNLHDSLKADGFRWLKYSEVLKLDAEQKAAAPIQEPVKKSEPVKVPASVRAYLDPFAPGGFYDEFPDAYGQYL